MFINGTILKRTSPEIKCLHPTSSRCEMCTSSVSDMIYHKFSHGAAFYTLNGRNVNVMLEFEISVFEILMVHSMSKFDKSKNEHSRCNTNCMHVVLILVLLSNQRITKLCYRTTPFPKSCFQVRRAR